MEPNSIDTEYSLFSSFNSSIMPSLKPRSSTLIKISNKLGVLIGKFISIELVSVPLMGISFKVWVSASSISPK